MSEQNQNQDPFSLKDYLELMQKQSKDALDQIQQQSKENFDRLEAKIDHIEKNQQDFMATAVCKADLEKQTETLHDRLTNYKSEVKGDFEGVEKDITEINSKINKNEKDIAEIKRDNSNRSRNHNIWIGIGAIVAVIIGVVIDHYLLR